MNTTTISHIVVMPKEVSTGTTSFFQGFSTQLFEDYAGIYSALSFFPHDLMEVFLVGDDLIASKISGSSLDIYQIREDLLDHTHMDFGRFFTVIWSVEETYNQTEKAILQFKYPTIHITTAQNTSAVNISELSIDRIKVLFVDAIDKLKKLSVDEHFIEFMDQLVKSEKNGRDIKQIPFAPLKHNCIAPMLNALYSVGYEASEYEDVVPVPGKGISQHIKNIGKFSSFIDSIRSESYAPFHSRKNDVIIFCASIYAYLYKSNTKLWNELFRKLSNKKRLFLRNGIVRNRGYGNLELKLENEDDIFNPYEDEILGSLLKIRQSELNHFTKIVSILASNQFCPSIRLPNSVMLHHDILNNIVSIIKSNNKKRVKNLNKKIRSYSDMVKQEIGPELVSCITNNNQKLLALCDFPIEWVSVDEFPIMVTHEISRIPSTPGNLFSQLALSGQRVMIPYKIFTKILILRSFSEDDPIKDHLKIALKVFDKTGGYENIKIELVDVECESDITNALNAFEGHIVVFDCHGDHGGVDKNSWLKIGADEIDIWSLANKCRIPPIVILSACSTHPIDGSHASVANGFFRSGAISVIGTYAPVNSIHAATFVARVLYRISEFVPIVLKQRAISWRDIISGFLKMSYSTDVLRGLHTELGLISEEQYLKMHNTANYFINSYQPDWTDKLIKLIAHETSLSFDEIREMIKQNFQFVETMLFSQLGRPENIIVTHGDS